MPRIAFGKEEITFELEPGDTLTEKAPSDAEVRPWREEFLRRDLERARFGEFVDRGRLLTVVNDAFRPTPNGAVLSFLRQWYPSLPADFIISCGNHPAPGESELKTIFGEFELPAESKVYFHNSRDYDTMAPAGESDGHTVYLNRRLYDYPGVVVIGSVEPHYFAGFTGGRKSIIPGLSDIETNRRNHALAVSPEAQPLRLKGNPVEASFVRLMQAVKLPFLFSIQIVSGPKREILGCFVGDLNKSFAEAAALAEQVYSFRLAATFDLTIAEMVPPLDRNLYQLQKAIENTAAAVRDGGTLLAVSACREGIGNGEFYQLACRLGDREAVLSRAQRDDPPLGIHKLSRIVRLAERIQVKALTELGQEVLKKVFIEPAVSIQDELHALRKRYNKGINVLLVRDAGLLVARLQ